MSRDDHPLQMRFILFHTTPTAVEACCVSMYERGISGSKHAQRAATVRDRHKLSEDRASSADKGEPPLSNVGCTEILLHDFPNKLICP